MRRLLSIRPITHCEIIINGHVTIEEGASIGPGVILCATSDESSIVIKAGACLGMGTVLAASGAIEIEAGAILGAGVLIVGKGKIGANVCIGTGATIFNSSIEPSTVILAGSLIGDPSEEKVPAIESPLAPTEETISAPEKENSVSEISPDPIENREENISKSPVVGKVYINQLLVTLFPGRQSINNSPHS